MFLRIPLLALLLSFHCLAQTDGVVVFDLEFDDAVSYRHDNGDPLAQAKVTGTTLSPAPKNFFWANSIQDLRFVNGSPARGIAVFQTYRINLSPTPAPGGTIADLVRGTAIQLTIEIQQPDGTQVGSLMMIGMGGGPPPPGSPGGLAFNLAIVGGTGAYLGATGHAVSRIPTTLGERAIPTRSTTEDPSQRRNLPSGTGALRAYVRPARLPVIETARHADSLPVTATNPARPGEMITLEVRNLGPTMTPVEYGAVFPDGNLAVVSSPVDVLCGATAVTATTKVGWPGTTNKYRVDFQVPTGIGPGETNIQVIAAFVPSAVFALPVGR